MDHRMGLLMAWLVEEGERQRHPFQLPPQVGDPAVRGWVHVGVCILAGALTAVFFAFWLATTWQRVAEVVVLNELRVMYFTDAGEQIGTSDGALHGNRAALRSTADYVRCGCR